MPYVTPDEVPEGDDCRPLSIPASTQWLAIVSGALTELTKMYNWEQAGGISVEDAVARCQQIIDEYYAGYCCSLVGGYPPIRLGEFGQIEQLIDGEWVEPDNFYDLPPTPARTEPTPDERLCLASANASAAFALFYENVSDSVNDGLTTAEAAVALATVVAGTLGATGFGLALSALIEIGVLIWGVFYAIVEFIAADVWTEEFGEKFTCVLLACASEEADVVHFDYDCVLNTLANATSLTLDLEEVRLFGQIAYLMQFIGAQGLDAMGATTSVEAYDCSECVTWCYEWLFNAGNADWYYPGGDSTCANYVADQYWEACETGIYKNLYMEVFGHGTVITHVEFDYERDVAITAGEQNEISWYDPDTSTRTVLHSQTSGTLSGTLEWDGEQFLAGGSVQAYVNLGENQSGYGRVTRILMRGNGTNPYGSNVCEP